MTGLCILDFLLRLKAKADWRERPVKWGRLQFGYVENYGVFHGLLKDQPKRVLKYQLLMVICCVFYTGYVLLTRRSSLSQVGWLLVSIGGLNNLLDRIWNGYVTDYVSVNGKLYFNIADLLVFGGCVIAFLAELLEGMPKTAAGGQA